MREWVRCSVETKRDKDIFINFNVETLFRWVIMRNDVYAYRVVPHIAATGWK